MPYTGEVTVGGPTDVRETPALTITKVATPPFENNCYVLRCTATGDTLLIDAAGDGPQLLALSGDRLTGVVETHDHWDHVQALAEVKDASGAPVLAHEADADDLPVPTDRRLQDGDTIAVGDCSVSVIHLVGHTPNSVTGGPGCVGASILSLPTRLMSKAAPICPPKAGANPLRRCSPAPMDWMIIAGWCRNCPACWRSAGSR